MALTKVSMGLLRGLAAKVLDIMKDHSNINLGEAKAATGTFIDFMIPEGVKRITVMFDGVSTNGTSSLKVLLGTASGFENDGYVGSGVRIATSGLAGAFSSVGFIYNNNSASDSMNGASFLVNIYGNTWSINGNVGCNDTEKMALSSGNKTLSGALDRIRITTVNGTGQFDAGTINVSWEY